MHVYGQTRVRTYTHLYSCARADEKKNKNEEAAVQQKLRAAHSNLEQVREYCMYIFYICFYIDIQT
jgi:hypothetical protein